MYFGLIGFTLYVIFRENICSICIMDEILIRLNKKGLNQNMVKFMGVNTSFEIKGRLNPNELSSSSFVDHLYPWFNF